MCSAMDQRLEVEGFDAAFIVTGEAILVTRRAPDGGGEERRGRSPAREGGLQKQLTVFKTEWCRVKRHMPQTRQELRAAPGG